MNYKIKRLQNNITVKTHNMPTARGVCIILQLKGGVMWEPAQQKGITHLVEHLCLRRCNGVCQQDFYYEIERIGGHITAVTHRDNISFEITINKKYFKQAIDIMCSFFADNHWTHEDIRKEKQVVYRQIEDGFYGTYKTAVQNYFDNTLAGLPILGTENKVKRCTIGQIIEWKSRLFCTDNATIVVIAGEIDDEKLSQAYSQFEKIAKTEKSGWIALQPSTLFARNGSNDRCYINNSRYAKMAVTFDIDTSITNKQQATVLHDALCKGALSPFSMILREDSALLHEFDSGVEFYDFGAMLYFVFEVKQELLLMLADNVAEIFVQQKNSLDKKSFECSKIALTDSADLLYNYVQEFAYLMLDEKVTTVENYIKMNDEISYNDAQAMARQTFAPNNMVITFCDVPNEQIADELYDKKENFRERMG